MKKSFLATIAKRENGGFSLKCLYYGEVIEEYILPTWHHLSHKRQWYLKEYKSLLLKKGLKTFAQLKEL